MGAGEALVGGDACKILLRHGKVVNDDEMFDADVYIENGIIKQVGHNLTVPPGTKTIDVSGKMIMPGGIDPNTHFDEPYLDMKCADTFYSGTRAAIAGGTTMIMGVVVPEPGESLLSACETWKSWADTKVCCDYALHVAIPNWTREVVTEMSELVAKHGIASFMFKLGLKSSQSQFNDIALYQAFEVCRDLGVIAQVYAENQDVAYENSRRLLARRVSGPEGHPLARSEDVEAEGVQRAIMIASQVHCPLYVTQITSKRAADAVLSAAHSGKIICGEVSAAALGTDGSHYWNRSWRHAAGFVSNPPLRPDPTTPGYLMDALSGRTTATGLSITASGDFAFNDVEKRTGELDFTKIPPGVNGVEDRMSVLWEKGVTTGKMDPTRFVAVTSSNAAKIFNLYPRKGRIAVGSDADIVVWDLDRSRTISARSHKQSADFNIFEGMVCRGCPAYVLGAGRILVDEGGIEVNSGSGQFIPLRADSPFLFWRIRVQEGFRMGDPLGPVSLYPDHCAPPSAPSSRKSSKADVADTAKRRPSADQNVEQEKEKAAPRTPTHEASPPIQQEAPRRMSTTRIQQPPGGKSSISFG